MSKTISRRLLEWSNKNEKKNPFLAGTIEGVIDGCIIMYPILLISCHYWHNKATKK